MEEPTDDIFEHIKKTLRSHEEAYQEGAWERFSRKYPGQAGKKRAGVIPLWKWAGAAAAILTAIVAGMLYFGGNKPAIPESQEVVKIIDPTNNAGLQNDTDKTITPVVPGLVAGGETTPAADKELTSQNLALVTGPIPPYPGGKRSLPAPDTYLPVQSTENAAAPDQQQPLQKDPVAVQQPDPGIQKDAIAQQPLPNPPINNYPWVHDNTPERKSGGDKKWTPSLFVSPTFTDGDVNMGYGVSVGYAVTDKIKISAGVAHNRLTATRSYTDAPAPVPAAAAAPNTPTEAFAAAGTRRAVSLTNNVAQPQTLESVKGTLSGLDVPLDISYNISSKLYATAGVSGLFILDNKTQYTVLTSNNVRFSVEDPQSISQENKSIQFNDRSTTENLPGTGNIEKTNMLGFYNLSVGFKQKVSPKNNVSVEPFIKIPMKNVSDQSLNYTGGGVRLKFDF